MATTDTLERRQVLRLQQLAAAPTTANDSDRTIELVVATETPVNGLILRCQAGSVEWGPAPVPVLLNHENHTGEMAGRLLSIRFEGGQMIALAQFTDAPAAEAGWLLARSGSAVSVGATFAADAIEPGRAGEPDVVTFWRLREASLVAVGADPMATTRAATSIQLLAQEGNAMTIETETIDREDLTLDKIERKRCTAILDCARKLRIDEGVAEKLIADGVALDEARMQLIDMQAQEQRKTPASARVEVDLYRTQNSRESLIAHLEPCFKGSSNQPVVRSLEEWLIEYGQISRHDRLNPKEIVNRAFSTSDFPIALQGLGSRTVLGAYQSTQNGLIAAAARKQLSDFRPVSGLRFSAIGPLSARKQGGEYKATGFSEEHAYELTAKEFGTLVDIFRAAFINDDVGMIDRLLSEAGRAAAETDRELLAGALGSISWTAKNSTSAAMGVEALGAAVLLLRRQEDAEKRPVSFEPDLVLAAPEHELKLRQLMGEYQPAVAADVQPFTALRLEIDHRLAEGAFYMVDTRYQPLMLGSIGDPVVSTQEEFRTGNLAIRVQHDSAACVVDTRSICKVSISS